MRVLALVLALTACVDWDDAPGEESPEEGSLGDSETPPLLVFVSSVDLPPGSLLLADAACTLLAREAARKGLLDRSLDVVFWAWLSTEDSYPAQRWANAPGPFVNALGEELAPDGWTLLHRGVAVPVLYDQAARPRLTPVWTGTSLRGTPAWTCGGWRQEGPPGAGTLGMSALSGPGWTDAPWSPASCDGSFPVYCVEG